MGIYDVIIRNIVTEKSSANHAIGQYVFEINKAATKIDVKKAFLALYGVEVATVNVIVSPKKTRLVGRGKTFVKRSVKKKAIVTTKGRVAVDINKIKEAKTK